MLVDRETAVLKLDCDMSHMKLLAEIKEHCFKSEIVVVNPYAAEKTISTQNVPGRMNISRQNM